jgi:hypothetical protein
VYVHRHGCSVLSSFPSYLPVLRKQCNRESLLQNPNFLQVALEDLQNFDDELCERLRTMPADYLPLVSSLNLLIL